MKQCFQIRLLLALSVLAAAPHSAYGQSGRVPEKQAAQQSQNADDPVRLRAEEVLLQVNVQSKIGPLPSKLDRADFIVTENDKRQQITSVMHSPANVLIIIDTSGTVTTLKNINIYKDLTLKIIESLGAEDKVALLTYADKVELLSSWTDDREAIKKALDWKYRPGPTSRLYDSLATAANEVLPKVVGRRSVILLTDGGDASLQSSFETALNAMQRARATVYIVSQAAMLLREIKPNAMKRLPPWQLIDSVARKQHELLQQYVHQLEAGQGAIHTLAEETGGVLWEPEKPIRCAKTVQHPLGAFEEPHKPDTMIDCETIRNQIMGELGSEYVVTYLSERKPGDTAFHPIKVYSTRTDVTVRVRRGIYSTSQSNETNHPGNQ